MLIYIYTNTTDIGFLSALGKKIVLRLMGIALHVVLNIWRVILILLDTAVSFALMIRWSVWMAVIKIRSRNRELAWTVLLI